MTGAACENYVTLCAAERWDNYSSSCSDPLVTLRDAIAQVSVPVSINIPRRIWRTMLIHPTIQQCVQRVRREPWFSFAWGSLKLELRSGGQTVERVVEQALSVRKGTVRVLDSPENIVRLRSKREVYEIRGVVEED